MIDSETVLSFVTLLDSAATTGALGAAVSIVITTFWFAAVPFAVEAVVLPAASVLTAVSVCAVSPLSVTAVAQLPLALTTAVPTTVAPS